MSFLDDIIKTGEDVASATGITGSPQQPAAPQISSRPAHTPPPTAWTAPDASGNGQFSVQRDTLSTVAKRIQSDLGELTRLVQQVQAVSSHFSSLHGWPTGTSFATNASDATNAIAQAGTQTGDAQHTTAKHLNDSSASYDSAEHFNTQNVYLVNDNLQSSGGSVSAASSIGQLL